MLVEAKFEVHAHDLGKVESLRRILCPSCQVYFYCFKRMFSPQCFSPRKLGQRMAARFATSPMGKWILEKALQNHRRCGDRMRLKGLGPGPHRTLLPWNTGKSKPQTRSSRLSKPALEPQKRSNVRLETLKGTNQKNDTSGMDMGVSFLRPDNHTNQQRQLSGSYALRVEAWIITIHHFQQHIHLILDESALIWAGACRRIQEFLAA